MSPEMTQELERQRVNAAKADEWEARVKATIDAVVGQPDPLRYLAAKLREARPDRAALLDEIDALISKPSREEARRIANGLGKSDSRGLLDNHEWAVAMLSSVAGGRTDEPKAVLRRAVYRLIVHHIVKAQRDAAAHGATHAEVTPEMESAALAWVAPPSRGQRP